MNRIILNRDGMITLQGEDGEALPAVSLALEGTWRIVVRDGWQYDERTISALHTLRARPGVDLLDPTGLLGGSRYGDERNAHGLDSVPVGIGADAIKIKQTRAARTKKA